jgi:transposase
MVRFFEKLAPTVIAIEACGASHHWARLLQSFGHSVKLIAPQLVKPYVKRGKNDTADADLYQASYLLIRPDQHVAWRGRTWPERADALFDQVSGRTHAVH